MIVNLGGFERKSGDVTSIRATVEGEVFEFNRVFNPIYEERHREHIQRGMFLELMEHIYDKFIKE
ncbi:hypothetical protein pXoo2106_27 [Xanthomonas phage pXoo2106]|uniref:Uncharacterized protein n=1 Tax=Xanthomonas phage pXoo2106 TaxID=2970483 RepID=A0AAX3C136_9CAUD|nr:hypothetical protein pXoo2106_27 [Xanthomonas phage pXoo2106]